MGVLEALASPSGRAAAILEGPAPPAEGLAPSLDLAACGPLPDARTSSPPKLRLLGWWWCSQTAPRVLSATGPLLARVGTECPAPDGPTAAVFFFLGAMAMKNRATGCKTRCSLLRAPYLACQRCRWGTTPMGSRGSLLRLAGRGVVRRAGLGNGTQGIYPGSGCKDA